MRSIWSSGIASSDVAPRRRRADAQRRRSARASGRGSRRAGTRRTCAPGPPFCTISTPGCRCSSSARLCAPPRAISSAPITVTSASSSGIGCGFRDAVTTTGSSAAAFGAGAGCALPRAGDERAASRRRSRRRAGGARRRGAGGMHGRHRQISAWTVHPRTAWSVAERRGGTPAHGAERGGRAGCRTAVRDARDHARRLPRRGRRSACAMRASPGAGRSPGSPCGSLAFPPQKRAAVARGAVLDRPYRCGGSRGIRARIAFGGTAFPFHPPRRNRGGHLLAWIVTRGRRAGVDSPRCNDRSGAGDRDRRLL